jgi:PmbA protein
VNFEQINQEQQCLAAQLLELAAKAGATAAEVFQSWSVANPVFFEANRLKQLESNQSEGTALRLWFEGRPGIAVAYGLVEPQLLVERALLLSQLNPPERIELAPATQQEYPDLGQEVPIEQLISWGQAAMALVRQAYPEVLCSGEWDCEVESTHLVNSQGLSCGYTDTTLSAYLSADWIRGDDFLNVADGQTQRGQLDPIALAEHLCQRLAWAKRNVSPPVGRVPVLFTAKAADMLWATLQSALNGKRVLEKSSPWSDRLGQQLTSPLLNLSQDPAAGPFSCPFDDEGTPTQPLNFIRDGVLQLFYTDRSVGRQLGIKTTGNGFRPDLGSYPTPELFNLLIQPGEQSFDQLVACLNNGLIVDQVLGSAGNISGDFSVNVDLGYRVRGGKIVGRVKDTMVTGNVYTALKNLVALGSDCEWNGAYYTPSLIVEGLSVVSRE